ncbi:MAG: DUF2807 domain-containing protein [Sphingomonas sp.]|uniref:GIN domain-containing protein n=1 Tax=Sphingomonas sp. TaxID=28214 RepID=UPI001AD07843|nr:DUF2807 domain-containing protein [Sphingomonas sp.]MBN8808063.1 DUF2807 domain-containing protein [Sphingomonas sp.]
MNRALAFLPLLALAAPAVAADRSFVVTNFDRVRVDGPFEVRVVVGGNSAKASASGDTRSLAALDVQVQGTTLVVRRAVDGWGEQGRTPGPAPIVTLTVPDLHGASVIGGGKLAIAGQVRGQRVDFTVTGNGSVAASAIDADQLIVTLIGAGTATLGGKAASARLLTNGSGVIAAMPLVVGDLTVRLDGPGETQVSARYTANVTTTGLGRIVVGGSPKCVTKAPAGGPVQCGAGDRQ